MRPSGGSPLILAFAFRRIPAWRDSWLPSLLTLPAIVGANVVFSAVGNGAATRAGTVVVFLWIAFISVRLLQKGDRSEPEHRRGRATRRLASPRAERTRSSRTGT